MVEVTELLEPWKGCDNVAWQLTCPCGCRKGAFLGYPLRRYNPRYCGDAFVGPLGFECSGCGQVRELLDTDKHGYHAEIGSSSCHIRGEGPREAFACPGCGSRLFRVVCSFLFWPATIDLVVDEPAEFLEVAEDLFNEFVAHGRCDGCGQMVRFTDFGKL